MSTVASKARFGDEHLNTERVRPETFVKGRVVSVVLDDNVIIGAPVYIEDWKSVHLGHRMECSLKATPHCCSNQG